MPIGDLHVGSTPQSWCQLGFFLFETTNLVSFPNQSILHSRIELPGKMKMWALLIKGRVLLVPGLLIRIPPRLDSTPVSTPMAFPLASIQRSKPASE